MGFFFNRVMAEICPLSFRTSNGRITPSFSLVLFINNMLDVNVVDVLLNRAFCDEIIQELD